MMSWTPRSPAEDEPACWSWAVPPLRPMEEEIERYMRLQVGMSINHTLERDTLESLWEADGGVGMRMIEFHTGVRDEPGVTRRSRCAICGRVDPYAGLVDEHCHATGQTRGYCCRSCNVREGRSGHILFVRYRAWHPAAILGLHRLYTGVGWDGGWAYAINPAEARRAYLGGEERPVTPWPAFDPSLLEV
jgi:hypothetical protein